MLKCVTAYTTLYSLDGEVIDGLGCDVKTDMHQLASEIAMDDQPDYACIQVTRVSFDLDGNITTMDVSADVAKIVAALYDDMNVSTAHEHFVSPLVSKHTDWEPQVEDPYLTDPRREHGLRLAEVL